MNKILVFIVSLLISLVVFATSSHAATLTLSPTSASMTVGERRTITLSLDPEKASVIGTDVMFRYEPGVIEVNSVKNSGVFPHLLGLHIDNASGSTVFALAHDQGNTQKQAETVAEIDITAKKPILTTALTFEFISGKTTDSNVAISEGRDVLRSTNAVVITISENTAGSEVKSSPTASPVVGGATSPIPSPRGRARPQVLAATTEDAIISPLPDDSPFNTQSIEKKSVPIEVNFPAVSSNETLLFILLLVGLILLFIIIKVLRSTVLKDRETYAYHT